MVQFGYALRKPACRVVYKLTWRPKPDSYIGNQLSEPEGFQMCFIRAYLRASTDEQDAARARGQVEAFAAERGMQIAAWYVENESGASLARPELFRLLADAHEGDILVVKQVDRLTRLD